MPEESTEKESACDYADCTQPTTVRSRTGRYCGVDHSLADSNDWDADEMAEYDVEYEGVEGTFRAPSQSKADSQWRSLVIARGEADV